jgi:hypothetical protein
MQCERISSLCVEVGKMGAGGDDDLAHISRIFSEDVLKAMVERVGSSPAAIKQLAAEIRSKLDALDILADALPGGGSGQRATASSSTSRIGTADSYAALGPVPDDGAEDFDDIGRNQRSRLRELALLEVLAKDNRPFALQQLMTALSAKGFNDTNGAVVSQLHRLKRVGVVDQPGNGMYMLTDSGLGHLRRLRSSFGGLLG